MYLDRLEQFFIVISDKCRAFLLSAIGEKTYRVLEDLCAPQNPNDRTFEEIKHLLLERFKPKYFIIVESHGFYNGESVLNFIVRFKCLSLTWEFEIFLERALQDKFVCGLNNESIQKRLLSEDMSLGNDFKVDQAM